MLILNLLPIKNTLSDLSILLISKHQMLILNEVHTAKGKDYVDFKTPNVNLKPKQLSYLL